MTNDFGRLELTVKRAIAEPGEPPRRTAALQTVNVIQWAL
jgi:hypothetical protein